ncbi:MAG: hypothetical protein ACOC2M_00555 [bacterium]
MLDLFVFSGSILAILFAFYGNTQFKPWAIFFSAMLFIMIALGLLLTGYETYDHAPITVNRLNSETHTIEFSTNTHTPNINGNWDERILYIYSIVTLIVGAFMGVVAGREANYNRLAKNTKA